ncbi:MAG: septum formation protein Maf [Solirubrobacterales bacterium]|nr:septum formation protein Maf [Solirubrobacterales bacterium]OJU93305.1 MAG: septum formation protein Maf [Solirubrobacterales bacterium 67-14]
MPDAKVILASGSPQRREILERLGIEFEVRVSGVEEIVEGDPAEVVLANALLKAKAIADEAPGCLVIGCDTDVVLEGQVIGKPEDEEMARQYLGRLSGRSHWVLSGLAIVGPESERVRTGIAESKVAFRELGEAEVKRYLASGEWRGRAGGYAIQGRGSALVAGVEGDVANVIGLPVGLMLDLAPELD